MIEVELSSSFWICCGVSCIFAAVAAISDQLRVSALALWVCGLGVGGVYISLGAEFLAVLQWIVSSLVGIGFVLYSLLFGKEEEKRDWLKTVPAFLIGLVFIFAISLVSSDLTGKPNSNPDSVTIVELGKNLVSGEFVSLIILSLTLLMTVIGSGVVSRPDSEG